ncbi:MAG TPA: apolipoprotein N-acyltransferase [Gammaproteobacteria bacterium]|nr:apolipoprotein N-acyltransferase [Gammaproteobacteria bacterium]
MSGLPERYSALLVMFAGAAAVTAFAPFGWFPVAALSLAVLFDQWSRDTRKLAFRHGLLFGAGFFGAGISWVFISIKVYGHVATPVAISITAGLIAFLSLYPALLGYFLVRAFRTLTPAVLLVAMPAGWVIAEWLRGWVFSGFPWLTMGSSQIDGPLGAYAPVLGVFGTGWTVALSASLLVILFRGWYRLPGLVLLLLLWGGGYLLNSIQWTEPRGEALQVALVQGNISQDDKWAPDNLLNTFSRYSELTFNETDVDLVVWPETAIPAFYDQVEDNFIAYLETELEKTGISLITGVPVLEKATWEYYNAVISLGGEQAFYYKQHLVPYGEYLPLRWLIGNTLDALAVPNADFSSGGASQPLLQAAGYPVSSSICYEIVFGEQIIRDLPEAAMLVNISNDAWFGNSLAPHQHLEMTRMRAKETGRPMLRATNTGISAVIDHKGRIVEQGPQFEIAVIRSAVVPMQGATPYVLLGNTPVIIFSFVGLLWCWSACRRKYNGNQDPDA